MADRAASNGRLRAEIHGVKAELTSEINGVKAEINSIHARLDALQAGQHELKAEIAFLVEEQNARNRIVLDALPAMIQRQERQEQRMDRVEETVRALAAARPAD